MSITRVSLEGTAGVESIEDLGSMMKGAGVAQASEQGAGSFVADLMSGYAKAAENFRSTEGSGQSMNV